MRTNWASATAIALFLSLSTSAAHAEEMTAWRLFISDHADPKVT
ncbi:hypothetical protein [Mesorhizobium sp. M5C.F.Cr.IN.023.01.1.1]